MAAAISPRRSRSPRCWSSAGTPWDRSSWDACRRRELPAFLHEKAALPIEKMDSPNFVPDRRNQGISWSRTVLHGLRNVLSYRGSFATIRRMMNTHKPDVIVSMYEPALAVYSLSRRVRAPIVHIAHQYLMLHPTSSCFRRAA